MNEINIGSLKMPLNSATKTFVLQIRINPEIYQE